MFTGIDEVDWASMRHANGSVEDVPGLLRGLASAEPAERDVALDGMYGAVHHQGDVYDSTLASIPFLFALVDSEEVRDRGGIVELLAGICGEGDAGDHVATARAALRAGAEAFVRLAGDRDAGVRRAAPAALVRFLDDPARVLGLLRERIAVERDDRVLLALTESLGLFARLHPGHAAGAVDLLTAQSAPPFGPGLRLAALGQLASRAPERLPADLVPTVVRLLRERSEHRSACRGDVCRGEAGCPGADTLVGRLRRLRPSDEEGSQLLRTLHTALGGRLADRIALLDGQLTSPDATDRCNAVWIAAGLFREWRGDHGDAVALIGAQLGGEEDALRDAAVCVLADLFGLAAPAADDLHALVTARPDLWVRRWERGAPALGGPLKALSRTGDPRATPVLAELLAQAVVPHDLGHVIVQLGPAATPLAPALRHRLGEIALDSAETFDRAVPLLSALAALGDEEAVPEVLRVLRGMPDDLRLRDAVVDSAVRALDAFGAAAGEAIPVLRGLLDTECGAAAAGALWSVEGETAAVLPVLQRELTGGRLDGRLRAAEVLARLGPSAGRALPELRRMAESDHVWERTAAACALWQIGGDADAAVPVLRAAWADAPHTRRAITACLARLGPAGTPLHDLVRTELAAPRRHQASSDGHGSQDIHDDEELLRSCREVLAGS